MSIEVMKLALEALELSHPMFGIATVKHKAATQALEQAIKTEDRQLQITLYQWDSWKNYAFELRERLNKYEGDSPMILNTTNPTIPNEPSH
jgi:hypothetical protein